MALIRSPDIREIHCMLETISAFTDAIGNHVIVFPDDVDNAVGRSTVYDDIRYVDTGLIHNTRWIAISKLSFPFPADSLSAFIRNNGIS